MATGAEILYPESENTAGSTSMQESEFTDNTSFSYGVLGWFFGLLFFFQSTEPVLQATCWPKSWEAKAVFPSPQPDFL